MFVDPMRELRDFRDEDLHACLFQVEETVQRKEVKKNRRERHIYRRMNGLISLTRCVADSERGGGEGENRKEGHGSKRRRHRTRLPSLLSSSLFDV